MTGYRETNPYEEAARGRKARAIADHLLFALPDMDAEAIEALRSMNEKGRGAIASHAGQRDPSPATWDRAIGIIEAVLADRARCAGDPFAGIGEDTYVRGTR